MHMINYSCTTSYKFPLLGIFHMWLVKLCLSVKPGLILTLITHSHQVTFLLLYNQAPSSCDTPT